MTLDGYIYEIRALVPKDWIDVDHRHIIRFMDLQRATWLKNELNNNRISSDKLSQKINIKMNLVERSEIEGVKSNSVILKSNVDIPTTILQYYKDSILSIHNADRLGEDYNYVTREEAIYSGNGKLNCNDVFAFIYKKRLYIKTQKSNPKIRLINNVVLEGLFENPVQVERDYVFKGEYFDFMNMEYPIHEALWTYMKEKVIQNGSILSNNEQIEDKQ